MKLLRLFLPTVLLAAGLSAAERIPPAPPRYFNDYAGVVGRGTADALNRQLEEFERATSSQLLVAIYPRMESESSVEDYTVRVAQAWRAGQQGRNNGAVLFAFMQEHQLYLQVGYGLEGAIPDALARRIIEQEIVPRLRAGDVDGGMNAAVTAMISAAKGEYKGTGATRDETRRRNRGGGISSTAFIILFVFIIFIASRRRRSSLPWIIGGPVIRNSWWDNSGGGSSWGGGGGGFSGGGGSFGGGGAGGKW